jgi:hypothetical protein
MVEWTFKLTLARENYCLFSVPSSALLLFAPDPINLQRWQVSVQEREREREHRKKGKSHYTLLALNAHFAIAEKLK